MPIPAAAIVAGASALIGTGTNVIAQGKMNNKSMRFAERRYQHERNDALADRDFANEYNSPAAQMERLKAAGLNPNLVYGDGGATSTSVNTNSTKTQSPEMRAPSVDLPSVSNAFFAGIDAENKQVQTDNLKKVGENLVLDGLLKTQMISKTASDIAYTNVNTQRGELSLQKGQTDLNQAQALNPLILEQAQQSLQKLRADTAFTEDSNERAAAVNSLTLQKGLEEIATIRLQRAKTQDERQQIQQSITNMKTDNQLKLLDQKLKEVGLQPGDPYYIRILNELKQKMPTPKEFKTRVDEILKNVYQQFKGSVKSYGKNVPPM